MNDRMDWIAPKESFISECSSSISSTSTNNNNSNNRLSLGGAGVVKCIRSQCKQQSVVDNVGTDTNNHNDDDVIIRPL